MNIETIPLQKKTMKKNARYLGRLISAKDLPLNDDGLRQCRVCRKSVHPPRRTMCSEECVHILKLQMNNRYVRECLYKRDNGICQICNIDTKNIAKNALTINDYDKRKEFLKNYKIGMKRKIWRRKHGGGLWDADHIVPVVKGGGLCGLENFRTLCISCHKMETKKLREELKTFAKAN